MTLPAAAPLTPVPAATPADGDPEHHTPPPPVPAGVVSALHAAGLAHARRTTGKCTWLHRTDGVDLVFLGVLALDGAPVPDTEPGFANQREEWKRRTARLAPRLLEQAETRDGPDTPGLPPATARLREVTRWLRLSGVAGRDLALSRAAVGPSKHLVLPAPLPATQAENVLMGAPRGTVAAALVDGLADLGARGMPLDNAGLLVLALFVELTDPDPGLWLNAAAGRALSWALGLDPVSPTAKVCDVALVAGVRGVNGGGALRHVAALPEVSQPVPPADRVFVSMVGMSGRRPVA